MKNIHILPTDKPSRFLYNSTLKSFCIQKEIDGMFINDGKVSGADFWGLEKALNNSFQPHNIYITSNEDINENDYFITKDGRLVDVSYLLSKDLYLLSKDLEGASKVVLTTDKDLIKDGVQAIDDTFLEWFVKNPSCEEVETKLIEEIPSGFTFGMFGNNEPPTELVYKIIIPREEPKQETHICKYCKAETSQSDDECYAKPKQETLEEAALSIIPDRSTAGWIDSFGATERIGFIKGAKWMQEKMYSEEDLLNAFEAGMMFIGEDKGSFREWFEKFKKK